MDRRHIFLFDAAVIVCKRRGDIYEMKEVIDLHLFKITNNPTSDKENRKVSTHTDMVSVENVLLCHAEATTPMLILSPQCQKKTLTD